MSRKKGTRDKNDWRRFKTTKQRGEWVELLFMAAAALYGFRVLKPWGDSSEYDVAIDYHGRLIRIQVKGFSARKGNQGGYLCRLRHGMSGLERYRPTDLDFFALYILPAHAWYIIPSSTVLLPTPKFSLSVYPNGVPARCGQHSAEHDYEPYREAWSLLAKSRATLRTHRVRR
jgi:hypothetical protein